MAIYNPRAGLLWWSQTAASSTLSVAGTYHSGQIDLRDVCDVWLSVYVAGTSTGVTPTLDVYLDLMDAGGNWLLQVLHPTQITTAPAYTSASAGIHIAGNGSVVLPEYGRITWVLAGTNPVYPQASISLYGR